METRSRWRSRQQAPTAWGRPWRSSPRPILPGNASNTCSGTVTVVDRTAPAISRLNASPNVLWPPNHKMVAVSLAAAAADACEGDVASRCQVVSVSANEPLERGDSEITCDACRSTSAPTAPAAATAGSIRPRRHLHR